MLYISKMLQISQTSHKFYGIKNKKKYVRFKNMSSVLNRVNGVEDLRKLNTNEKCLKIFDKYI